MAVLPPLSQGYSHSPLHLLFESTILFRRTFLLFKHLFWNFSFKFPLSLQVVILSPSPSCLLERENQWFLFSGNLEDGRNWPSPPLFFLGSVLFSISLSFPLPVLYIWTLLQPGFSFIPMFFCKCLVNDSLLYAFNNIFSIVFSNIRFWPQIQHIFIENYQVFFPYVYKYILFSIKWIY